MATAAATAAAEVGPCFWKWKASSLESLTQDKSHWKPEEPFESVCALKSCSQHPAGLPAARRTAISWDGPGCFVHQASPFPDKKQHER